MINEKNIKNIIMLLAAFFLVYSCMPRDARPYDELQDNTNRTMGEVKNQQQSIGSEVDFARNELGGIGQAHARASDALDAMQERLGNQSNKIAECRSIISECRSIVEENGRIFQEAGNTI